VIKTLCAAVCLWVVALGGLPAGALSAHHSIQAGFDITRTETVTGVITKMEWRNPHAWLHIEVKDASGKVTPYAVEFGAANAMYRRGWRQDDLPVGATVTVTGFVARDGSKTLTGNEVKLADGRTLFGGTNPTGN
jgi:hypothetical protein